MQASFSHCFKIYSSICSLHFHLHFHLTTHLHFHLTTQTTYASAYAPAFSVRDERDECRLSELDAELSKPRLPALHALQQPAGHPRPRQTGSERGGGAAEGRAPLMRHEWSSSGDGPPWLSATGNERRKAVSEGGLRSGDFAGAEAGRRRRRICLREGRRGEGGREKMGVLERDRERRRRREAADGESRWSGCGGDGGGATGLEWRPIERERKGERGVSRERADGRGELKREREICSLFPLFLGLIPFKKFGLLFWAFLFFFMGRF
ncbi:uncharacterized protein LOC131004855 [Salvia miltiorrhiza]|uniref:uncharacterized protein LOC131004855 n=1 Tax=Salvia miltiorrhiza TaxID=226208 RepID=UPI0025AD1B6D|nr:uncharacterized protein LOC131004855 [Salvia miltiorrhiza]